MQIAKQARNERGQMRFQIFSQEESEVHIASAVRWETQPKGLVEPGKRCQELIQEVEAKDKKFWLALWKTIADYRAKRPKVL